MRRVCLLIASLSFFISASAQKDYYSHKWSNVYRYEMKALPRSAAAVVDSIYKKAKADNDIPQLTKALLYQSKFTIGLEENAELIIVKKFKAEIAQSKAPLRNILESMLGRIYWDYFERNRHNYYDRSHTSEIVNREDFRTWDLENMFNETHQHFQNSLKDAEVLQKIDLITINDILIQSYNSKLYRPTVYDLLAHIALDFYESGEGTINKPIGKFVINDIRYFNDFENIKLTSTDSLSPNLQSLHIFQSLLIFHKKNRDSAAYVDLEIERLQFLLGEADVEGKEALRIKELHKLKTAFAGHSSSTLIDFEIANYLEQQGNNYSHIKDKANQFKKKEALQICDQAIKAFPKSDGAEKCKALISG